MALFSNKCDFMHVVLSACRQLTCAASFFQFNHLQTDMLTELLVRYSRVAIKLSIVPTSLEQTQCPFSVAYHSSFLKP